MRRVLLAAPSEDPADATVRPGPCAAFAGKLLATSMPPVPEEQAAGAESVSDFTEATCRERIELAPWWVASMCSG